MRTSLRILKRDLLALLKNPIALLVVGALLILPGLYAWYCIVANWDPYANTGRMPIAVVNLDKGAESDLAGEVDIGAQVTENLRDNDSIDWVFYDSEEEALEDTRNGTVYATLVMPEDLSENVLGIFAGSDEKPTIFYYPNEKYNAVATKVTDSAAQTLVRQIDQGFSSTVNKRILESAQEASDDVEARADSANKSAIAEIRGVQEDLEKVNASLDDALASIEGWRKAAQEADAALAASAEQLPGIRALLDESAGDLDSLREKTGEFESGLSSSVLDSAATVSRLSAESRKTLAQAAEDLAVVEERLEALSEAAAGDPDLQEVVDLLDGAAALLDGAVVEAYGRVAELDAKVQDVTGSVSSGTSQISREVMPQLSRGSHELSTSFSRLSGAVGQFEPQVVQLRDVLAQTDAALDTATGAIDDAKALLSTISGDLRDTVADIGAIGRAVQIDELAELLDVDPDSMGTFISSPVQMVTEEIDPVSNYGTAVAPFYTNLALWIGCFILVSLMKLEVDRRGFEQATATQRYFGRWLLFVILALLQSQVICGVDVLLGIDCAHPALFMLAGAFCSFAYMNLIFALALTFRNIGKTLCILLLIMQVPGSSGMYPIEMMPGFFRFIHPALPFTYGIDAMREALCGLYETAYAGDLCVLLAIVPVSLLLGVLVRPRLLNLTDLFDREMSATGFFASEVHGQGAQRTRAMGIMAELAKSDSYRDRIEERAWKFSRRYPRLRRAGTVAAFAVPFAFLLLMGFTELFFEPTVNTKLFWLVVMLAVLLMVQVALIVVEHLHRTVTEQTKILGLAILNESDFSNDAGELLELTGRLLDDPDEPGSPDDPCEADDPCEPGDQAAGMRGADQVLQGRRTISGPARDVFLTDLRLGFASAVGVVVITLLVITPSLYAWFNIAGSWDPYSATGNLKVAVVNDDEGYKGDLVPVTINIGDTVVSQLRGNNSFDWVFVGKDEAVSGVESGEYYAAIEIPPDFSRSMMTYLTEDAEYPDVVYYTNEKENPIAPIITQKGADSIQENIRVSFTERIDEVVLGVAYDLLDYLTNPRMSEYAVTMGKHLDDAVHDTRGASRELKALAGLTRTVSGVVATTGATLDGVMAAGEAAKGAVGEARSGLEDAGAAFGRATSIAQEMLDGREVDIGEIDAILDVAFDVLEAGAEGVPERIDAAIEQVEQLKEASDDPALDEKFDAVIASLEAARRNAAAVPGKIESDRADAEELVGAAQAELADAKAYFTGTVRPSIDDLEASLGDITESTSEIVDGLGGTVQGIGESTGGLGNQLTALSEGLGEASAKLEKAADNVDGAKERVAEALRSGDLRQVEDVILGGDTEAIAASLAAPVQLDREPVYAVANYGSAMAPFYTVLSLWVGALVMISTMRARVAEERVEELRRRYRKVRLRHEFFGRYGIFGLVGLLQSALVLLGDLLLLHIQCSNPVMFVLCGIFIGQVFCLVVYTLTELFGDVGKALCVILLIMQVAASGGTFPVQMLDPMLSTIVPFLPFFHGMSMLQECVAGISWAPLLGNAGALLATVAVALVAGIPLRRPFRFVNDFFEEQLEKTGYM